MLVNLGKVLETSNLFLGQVTEVLLLKLFKYTSNFFSFFFFFFGMGEAAKILPTHLYKNFVIWDCKSVLHFYKKEMNVANVISICMEKGLKGNILTISSSCFWMFGILNNFRNKISGKQKEIVNTYHFIYHFIM